MEKMETLTPVMKQIRDARYDFAILDPIHCCYVVPYSLGIPYATMSVPFYTAHLFRVPRLSSFPNALIASEPPTFLERLTSFVAERMDVGILSDNAHLVEKTHQIVPFQTPQNLFGASRCGCLSKICQSATLCLKCPTLLPSEISWSEPRNDLCPAEFRSLFESRNAEWLLRLSAVSATSSRRLLLSNFAMPLRKPRNVSECPLYGS